MVSDTVKHGAIGGGVVFLIAMIAAFPLLGLFFGPIFTLGGGLVGGAVAGYLEKDGVGGGIKTGTMAGVGGGIASAIVGTLLGTLLNVLMTMDGGNPEIAGWLYLAFFGVVSGLLFTSFGGMVGGIFGGAVAGEENEFERPDQRGRHAVDPSTQSEETDPFGWKPVDGSLGGPGVGVNDAQSVDDAAPDDFDDTNPWTQAEELPSGSDDGDAEPADHPESGDQSESTRERLTETESSDSNDDPEWERIS